MKTNFFKLAMFGYMFLLAHIGIAKPASLPGINFLIENAHKAALKNLEQSCATPKLPAANAEKMNTQLAQQSLYFTENKGQVADMKGNLRPDILFTAHSGGVKLFITENGIHYQFRREFLKKKSTEGVDELQSKFDQPEADSTQFYRLDLSLKGAKPHPQILKEGEGTGVENFYLAHCPNGIRGVKNYNRITYKDVYPNIDWVVYTKGSAMEYDFVVNPGGKTSDIQLSYEGAQNISLDKNGNLIVKTPLGFVTEQKPFSFQQKGKEIQSKFVLNNNKIGFDCNYDKTKILIIDPNIEWATYYGGSSEEYGKYCTADALGNIYLSGNTFSTTGIASAGSQNVYGGGNFFGGDAFVVKLNSVGIRLWATYYGGINDDYGLSCCVDNADNIFLAGYTASSNNISYGGFQNSFGGGNHDAFLVKFNSLGSREWATYYGGTSIEYGYSCCVDKSGNIYLAGLTYSPNKISSGGFQNSISGVVDAFLVKFKPSGERIWATYYGGPLGEVGRACFSDSQENVYLSGWTSSTSGVAANGFQNTFGGGGFYSADAFLVKFNSDGNRLWGTYYGGNSDDFGWSCTVDIFDDVYMAGRTESTTNIAYLGFQNTFGGGSYPGDAFLVKFNSGGNRVWATYYGGSDWEFCENCTADLVGNIYLIGDTRSSTGIASLGLQNTFGGAWDAFLVKFDNSGNRIWSTYYGGSGYDYGNCAALDNAGSIYLTGKTSSISGIAYNGFQNTYSGSNDAFLVKIKDGTLPLIFQNFSATFQNKASVLIWQTVTELNTKSFTIQRSSTSRDFTPIGTVSAKSSNSNYSYIDNLPMHGINYYRLKITDKDGTINYSEIRSINYSSGLIVRIYPNPVKDKLTIEINSDAAGKTNIIITTITGKTVQQLTTQLQSGNNKIYIPVAGLQNGIYSLRINSNSVQQTMKFVKE